MTVWAGASADCEMQTNWTVRPAYLREPPLRRIFNREHLHKVDKRQSLSVGLTGVCLAGTFSPSSHTSFSYEQGYNDRRLTVYT